MVQDVAFTMHPVAFLIHPVAVELLKRTKFVSVMQSVLILRQDWFFEYGGQDPSGMACSGCANPQAKEELLPYHILVKRTKAVIVLSSDNGIVRFNKR
jgi:hypothetical protein